MVYQTLSHLEKSLERKVNVYEVECPICFTINNINDECCNLKLNTIKKNTAFLVKEIIEAAQQRDRENGRKSADYREFQIKFINKHNNIGE